MVLEFFYSHFFSVILSGRHLDKITHKNLMRLLIVPPIQSQPCLVLQTLSWVVLQTMSCLILQATIVSGATNSWKRTTVFGHKMKSSISYSKKKRHNFLNWSSRRIGGLTGHMPIWRKQNALVHPYFLLVSSNMLYLHNVR